MDADKFIDFIERHFAAFYVTVFVLVVAFFVVLGWVVIHFLAKVW